MKKLLFVIIVLNFSAFLIINESWAIPGDSIDSYKCHVEGNSIVCPEHEPPTILPSVPYHLECPECPKCPAIIESWHLMTSNNGNLNLIKHLSKHACEYMKNRFLGKPATAKEELADRQEIEKFNKCYENWYTTHPKAKETVWLRNGDFYFTNPPSEPYKSCGSKYYPDNSGKTAECFQ